MAHKTRLKVTDPPSKSVTAQVSATSRGPAADTADARDILSMFTGGGHTSLQDPEIKKAYTRLSAIVGTPLAQKLTTQAFLYNQRPETVGLKPEQRVQGFFELGANDPEVAGYLKNAKGIGYGQLDGFRNSPLIGNRMLMGKDVGANTKTTPEKVKLIVKRQ